MVEDFDELEGFEEEFSPAQEAEQIEFGLSDKLREFIEKDEYPPLDNVLDPTTAELEEDEDDAAEEERDARIDALEEKLLLGALGLDPELLTGNNTLYMFGKPTTAYTSGATITLDRKRYKVIGSHRVGDEQQNIQVNLKREGKLYWVVYYPDGRVSRVNYLRKTEGEQ